MSTGSAVLVDQDGHVVGRIFREEPRQKFADRVYGPVIAPGDGVLSNKTRPEDFARFAELAGIVIPQQTDTPAVEEAPALEPVAA